MHLATRRVRGEDSTYSIAAYNVFHARRARRPPVECRRGWDDGHTSSHTATSRSESTSKYSELSPFWELGGAATVSGEEFLPCSGVRVCCACLTPQMERLGHQRGMIRLACDSCEAASSQVPPVILVQHPPLPVPPVRCWVELCRATGHSSAGISVERFWCPDSHYVFNTPGCVLHGGTGNKTVTDCPR